MDDLNIDPRADESEVRARLAKIVEWQANPLDDRTVAVFCESEGIPLDTYYRFKRIYRDYINTQVEAKRKIYASELRTAGYKALMKRLPKSDNAAKLLFQLLGDLVEKTEVRQEFLTPDQKRDKVQKMLDALHAKRAAAKEAKENGPKA